MAVFSGVIFQTVEDLKKVPDERTPGFQPVNYHSNI